MTHLKVAFGRLFWIVCACALLLPRLATAESSLVVDFDGDGQRDHVTFSRHEPSVLRIWLSTTGTTQIIDTLVPVGRIIAADLDGDHRPELVAGDSHSGIRIWTRKHKRFKPYRPYKAVPITLQTPNRRTVDDEETQPSDSISTFAAEPLALLLCPTTRAPAPLGTQRVTVRLAGIVRCLADADPFLPRPPPAAFPR